MLTGFRNGFLQTVTKFEIFQSMPIHDKSIRKKIQDMPKTVLNSSSDTPNI